MSTDNHTHLGNLDLRPPVRLPHATPWVALGGLWLLAAALLRLSAEVATAILP